MNLNGPMYRRHLEHRLRESLADNITFGLKKTDAGKVRRRLNEPLGIWTEVKHLVVFPRQ